LVFAYDVSATQVFFQRAIETLMIKFRIRHHFPAADKAQKNETVVTVDSVKQSYAVGQAAEADLY
jgi:hypothetical protein